MKINLIGDIALNDNISENVEILDKRYHAIANLISPSDISIANLETPVKSDTSNRIENSRVRITKESVLQKFLSILPLDILSIANNHILDVENNDLRKTIDLLKEKSIHFSGIKSEPDSPLIYTNKSGFSVGFLAYVHPSTHPFSSPNSGNKNLRVFIIEKMLADIKSTRQNHKVNLLIVSVHWGKDYSNYFEPWQQQAAYKIIDAGADVIMGHHPHTIQPYEIYKGKPIFYSLGGLCFGDFYWQGKLRALKRKTKLGMIAVINENAEIIEIIPTKELKGNYVIIPNINIGQKIKRLFFWNSLKNKYLLVNLIIKFKESFIDRAYEYFFGYYRNPFNQLLSFKNFKKISYLFRDFRS